MKWWPCWCSKTMKRRTCWCTKTILRGLNSFLMQNLSCCHKFAQMLTTWVKTLYIHGLIYKTLRQSSIKHYMYNLRSTRVKFCKSTLSRNALHASENNTVTKLLDSNARGNPFQVSARFDRYKISWPDNVVTLRKVGTCRTRITPCLFA